MTYKDVALASNYIYMLKEVEALLADIYKGREVNPSTITGMFPWERSIGFLKGLLEERRNELEAKLGELDVRVA